MNQKRAQGSLDIFPKVLPLSLFFYQNLRASENIPLYLKFNTICSADSSDCGHPSPTAEEQLGVP